MGNLRRWLAVCGMVLLLGACPARAETPFFPPGKTWVFVAGLLEWKHKEAYGSFPKKGRRDAELVSFFRKAGVPREQLVYLQDGAATSAAIRDSLAKTLDKTRPGDVLFLYYCGHGGKAADGAAYFASYDAGDTGNPGWAMAAIPAEIQRRFHGERAFLAADCCASGGMTQAVQQQRGKVSFACLTSSGANEVSTGNWTFTAALLDGLRGAPGCNGNGDGAVSLGELAAYVEKDMAFGEQQLASSAFTGSLNPRTALSDAGKSTDQRVGSRVEVLWQGTWYKARITEVKGEQVKVHWFGFDDYPDEWVAARTVRNAAPVKEYAPGSSVEVQWKGKWYPATVLRAQSGIHLVHYKNYGSEWDEWAPSRRVRLPR